MKCTFKIFLVWEKDDMKYYRGLLFWGGRGMHVPSLDFKSDCFVYWRGVGADPGFFAGGWLIPIGHQTIREFILSFPAFVPKHGNLGRAKAGWLHKVFVTHVFLYFWDYSHISICLSKYYMECSKGVWLATQSTSPGSALQEAMSLSVLYDCICNVVCSHFNCFNYVAVSRPSCRLLEFYPNRASLF